MTDKHELLQELQEAFKKEKERLGFIASFEELDSVYFIKDMILQNGFVSDTFSRSLCRRICDSYNAWASFTHRLLMPNPGSIPDMKESKSLQEEDKKKLQEIMHKSMEFSSRNSLIGLKKDYQAEAAFIDETLDYFNNTLAVDLIPIMEKVNSAWKEEEKEEAPQTYGGVS